MMNGFLSNKQIFKFDKKKTYKVPIFYKKGQTHVNVTSSEGIDIKKSKMFISTKKQYVEFNINDKFDLNAEHFIKFNSKININININYDQTNIKFIENIFQLNSNSIDMGNNNYNLYKSTKFKNPIIILKSSTKKSKIKYILSNDKSLSFDLKIDKKDDYTLIIKDGVKSQMINFDWVWVAQDKALNTDVIDFTVDTTYDSNSQKVKILLTNKYPLYKNIDLEFTGNLNKEVVWKKGEKIKEIFFQKQILKYEKLLFKINNNIYSKLAINPNFFPSKMSKTMNGIRFDKTLKRNLTLIVDNNIDEKLTIQEKSIEYNINWEGKKNFKVYFDNILLFDQDINNGKYLPDLHLVNNPLKAVISHPYYEDVLIEFKGIDKKYIIQAGKTEVELDFKTPGIRKITILNIENAKPIRKNWKLII